MSGGRIQDRHAGSTCSKTYTTKRGGHGRDGTKGEGGEWKEKSRDETKDGGQARDLDRVRRSTRQRGTARFPGTKDGREHESENRENETREIRRRNGRVGGRKGPAGP